VNGSKLAAYARLAPAPPRPPGPAAGRATTASRTLRPLPRLSPCVTPASKTFYDRKRAEGKRHNAALVCLARRCCDVTLAMLRTRQPCTPTQPAPCLSEAT
jgi:hypothetical protein